MLFDRRRNVLWSVVALLGMAVAAHAQTVDSPVELWPAGHVPDAVATPPESTETVPVNPKKGGAPIIKITNVSVPTLTVYHPSAALDTHVAMVVFPGGGYKLLAYNLEGTEVCQWLNSIGITGVLVKYRVPLPDGGERGKLPLEDAQRAIRLVRSHAADWHIDANRIGSVGFSAGGNLSALVSTHVSGTYPKIDAADDLSPTPNFAMVIYPGYLAADGTNNKIQSNLPVTKDVPPTFMVQAENDPLSINAVAYFLALQAAKVPVEMHLYAEGGHGFGLRPTTYPVSHWTDLATTWLHTIKILP